MSQLQWWAAAATAAATQTAVHHDRRPLRVHLDSPAPYVHQHNPYDSIKCNHRQCERLDCVALPPLSGWRRRARVNDGTKLVRIKNSRYIPTGVIWHEYACCRGDN